MPAPWRLVGTFFGTGASPIMPGTCGSLAAAALIVWIPGPAYGVAVGALAVVATLIGPRIADRMIRESGRKDPQDFVLDEAAGVWIAAFRPENPGLWAVAVALVVFRVLDILKPWPIRRIEQLPGGIGVVYDDVFAGSIALGAGLIIERVAL